MSAVKCTTCGSLTIPCLCVTRTLEACKPNEYRWPKIPTLDDYFDMSKEPIYTQSEVQALLKQQRELCSKEFLKMYPASFQKQGVNSNANKLILNAPSPLETK